MSNASFSHGGLGTTSTSRASSGGVIALGNFDGVHRGHRAVIAAAVEKATQLGCQARVVTFEPHPRTLFKPEGHPFRLTPFGVKQRLLKALGIDEVIALDFSQAFALLSAPDFVETILLKAFCAQHIVAGHDFVFGHNRSGTMQDLARWLAPTGTGVTEVSPQKDDSGIPYSSTVVRRSLQNGDTFQASEILGRTWAIEGTVVKGAQRGRTLGFPTANIGLGDYLRPKFGVYAIDARQVGVQTALQAPFSGVANIGTRPTVDGTNQTLEAHLFDFSGDMYDQEWEFSLKRFIRPEQKFESLEALSAQIKVDVAAAR